MSDGVPVSEAVARIRLINEAMEDGKWGECAKLADEVCWHVKLALDPKTSRTGSAHLDGVFPVGTMYYERAPRHVRDALNKMNRIIRSAKDNLK